MSDMKREVPADLITDAVDPTSNDRPHQMVYMVFDDGEMCLTKCRDLFGHRGLHMIGVGNPEKTVAGLPRRWPSGNGYAAFDEEGPAKALRDWILGIPSRSTMDDIRDAVARGRIDEAKKREGLS